MLAANGLRSVGSKIRKRQLVRNADADLRPDFHYHPLNLNATFRTRSMNSCYRPTKLPLPKFHSNIFTEPPKYVKLHVIAENCQNSPEMTEQCSRCSLPTGPEASDQKSENVKPCAKLMPTYDFIFVIIHSFKTSLRTGIRRGRIRIEYINRIVFRIESSRPSHYPHTRLLRT